MSNTAAAAGAVRTASDLLATHRDHDGVSRSPAAAVRDDPRVRATGLAELVGLVRPVAEAATHLRLRGAQAGMPWQEVERLLPEAAPLLAAAVEARLLGNVATAGSPLATLEVARPQVRSGDPVVGLGDRLARLHRMAWQLTREPHVGVGTLAEIAAAAVMVHTRASRHLRGRAAASPPDHAAHQALAQVDRAGAAWRQAHLHLRQLRTSTPALLVVRDDVAAVRRLLEQTAPGADVADASRRGLDAALIGGARSFAEVAGWNGQVLDRLASTGQVLLPARSLSGQEVSEHPALAEAKIRGRLVPVSPDRLAPLAGAYLDARRSLDARSRKSTASGAPVVTPAERDLSL